MKENGREREGAWERSKNVQLQNAIFISKQNATPSGAIKKHKTNNKQKSIF